jgi:hypothetical protein
VECSIKRANIDAELESTCGGHAEELAREKGLWKVEWRGGGEQNGEAVVSRMEKQNEVVLVQSCSILTRSIMLHTHSFNLPPVGFGVATTVRPQPIHEAWITAGLPEISKCVA